MFEIDTITYQVFSCKPPSCLHSLLTSVRKSGKLRSSSSDLLFAPKVNTSIGTSAFAVGEATLCNVLPSSVKSVENIGNFSRHLNTYFYKLTYPP